MLFKNYNIFFKHCKRWWVGAGRKKISFDINIFFMKLVLQFNSALKKILLGATHQGNKENCLVQDSTVLILPSNSEKSTSMFEQTYELKEEQGDRWLNSSTDIYLCALQNVTEYKCNVVNYIAGYIQKQLIAKESCVYCHLFLSNMKIVHGGLLLNRKNRGGLTLPSVEFEKVVKIGETLFCTLVHDQGGNPFKVNNLVDRIALQASKIIKDLHPSLLLGLDNHVETMGSHRNLMIKKILGCYISMRAKHFCKEYNRQAVKVRVQLSKLILLKNQ